MSQRQKEKRIEIVNKEECKSREIWDKKKIFFTNLEFSSNTNTVIPEDTNYKYKNKMQRNQNSRITSESVRKTRSYTNNTKTSNPIGQRDRTQIEQSFRGRGRGWRVPRRNFLE